MPSVYQPAWGWHYFSDNLPSQHTKQSTSMYQELLLPLIFIRISTLFVHCTLPFSEGVNAETLQLVCETQ